MNDNIKISIVIPLYNKSKYIYKCLESVVAQTCTEWECIIVDDGSTDDSAKIVTDFIELHPGRWTLLKQENTGPSAARNLGILNARGKYIALLDADDLWLPEKLKVQSNFMDHNPDIDLTITNYLIFDSGAKANFRAVRSPGVNKLINRWLDMRGFGGLIESTGMLRRDLSSQQVLFDHTLVTTEGLDFMIRFSAQHKIKVIRRFLTLYRISNGQLHKREDLIKMNAFKMVEKYFDLYPRTSQMNKYQSSYFFLSSLRGQKLGEVFLTVFRNLLRSDMRLIQMIFWILSRNIRAKVIPVSTKKSMIRILGK